MESASGTVLKTSIPFFKNGVVDWESDPLSEYLLENGKVREAELKQIEKVSNDIIK